MAQELVVSPLDPDGIYDLGEKVGWTVALPPGAAAPTQPIKYTVAKNGQDEIQSGTLDFASGAARIEVAVDEPAMLYATLKHTGAGEGAPAGKSGDIHLGAAVAPENLRPVAPRPDDFDSFWQAKIEELHRVPENAVITPVEAGRDGVEFSTVTMDHIGGEHVYGQLAKPAREGKFPALVIFQWASPPYPLQKSWVVDRAAQGWLALNIEPHNVPVSEPQSLYDALPNELKHYESIGNKDRDHSYFLRMYLADYRAVDYLASRPDWDGRTLVVMGTSMGGQQSLCVAGLHPKITHLIVNVPAGCDTNGPLHGRHVSYPFFPANDPQVMKTALYFDAVNFAPHIHATSLVAMGFVDEVSAPAGIWTAFNEIAGPKEAAPMIDSPHNHLATPEQQRPFAKRSEEWLGALVHGGTVTPRDFGASDGSVAVNLPIAQSDANSQVPPAAADHAPPPSAASFR